MNEQIQRLRVLAAEANAIADTLEQQASSRPAAPAAAPPASPYRQSVPTSTPTRPGPRSSGPCAPNFGKNAGAPLEVLDDRDLTWYRGAIERSLQDETKARYTAANQKMLAEIIDEQNRRFTR